MDDAIDDTAVQHVYDFAKLERVAEDHTSLAIAAGSSAAPLLTGRSIVCALVRRSPENAARVHNRGSERFDYVLQGTLVCDIGDERVTAARGAIVHAPAGVAHGVYSVNNQDTLFYHVSDTRAESGGAHAHVAGKRYVYDMRDVHDSSRALASADVTPDAALRLPPGVTGKLLSGERLHVCVLRLEPGAMISNYRKDNEQLVFAAEGDLQARFEDDPLEVPQHCVLHLPPGTRHEIQAARGAVIVIAQDKGAAG